MSFSFISSSDASHLLYKRFKRQTKPSSCESKIFDLGPQKKREPEEGKSARMCTELILGKRKMITQPIMHCKSQVPTSNIFQRFRMWSFSLSLCFIWLIKMLHISSWYMFGMIYSVWVFWFVWDGDGTWSQPHCVHKLVYSLCQYQAHISGSCKRTTLVQNLCLIKYATSLKQQTSQKTFFFCIRVCLLWRFSRTDQL